MPIHIKELRINTRIDEVDGKAITNQSAATTPSLDTEDLIKACVEQVLQILKQRKER